MPTFSQEPFSTNASYNCNWVARPTALNGLESRGTTSSLRTNLTYPPTTRQHALHIPPYTDGRDVSHDQSIAAGCIVTVL